MSWKWGLTSVVLCLSALTCIRNSVAAEPHWARAFSTNFEIYSSAGARSIRDTLREFEQVRGFFIQAFGGPPEKPVPIRLVTFGSAKEYEPYRLNEFATAYYHQSMDRDYIVMSHGGADMFPTAVHEYVHLLVRHFGLTLPPWLDEGLAELYSTLKPAGDKILVGSLIEGRYREMLDGKWVPLATILTVDHSSPYYNEKNKAGNLYNEGWALTHMLYFRAEYRPKFGQLVRLIDSGTDSSQALSKVYGRSVAQVEKDLQAYLRGTTFQGILVPAKLEKSTEDLPIEAASPFDADLVLADLTNRPGKEQAYQAALEQLIQQDARRPEPLRGLAYLAWRAGRQDEAIRDFGRAFTLGDRDQKMLWDYGRLLEPSNPAGSIPVLWELLAKDPARIDVRIEIASCQLRENQAEAALQVLQPVRTVPPDLASRFFRLAVLAHLGNGDEKAARATAERFQSVAKNEEQRSEAAMLLAQASAHRKVIPAEALAPPAEIVDTGKPRLRRADVQPSSESEDRPSARPAISGRFTELECLGNQARVSIETSAGKALFLIEDPSRIVIAAGAGGPVDLKCGLQKPAPAVRVEYTPASTPRDGIQGSITALTFEQ